MKAPTPKSCLTIEAARQHVDRLDRELIAILQQRSLYSERVAELRGPTLSPEVITPFLNFMKDRRAWGKEAGLDSDYIDQVFTIIAQRYFDKRLEDASNRSRVFR